MDVGQWGRNKLVQRHVGVQPITGCFSMVFRQWVFTGTELGPSLEELAQCCPPSAHLYPSSQGASEVKRAVKGPDISKCQAQGFQVPGFELAAPICLEHNILPGKLQKQRWSEQEQKIPHPKRYALI